MIIPSGSKHIFSTGTFMDPSELTAEFDFINDVLTEVQSQRIVHSSAPYSFQPFSDVSYTLDPERLKLRFRVPTAAEIERVWIGAYYESTVAIDGLITNASGATPSEIINPYFQLSATDGYATSYNDVVAQQPIRLTANQDYVIAIQPHTTGGTFTFKRLDLTIVFKTDTYNFTEVLNLNKVDYEFTEADPPNATTINNILSNINTKISAAQGAIAGSSGARAMLFQIQNVNASSSTNMTTFTLPLAPSDSKMTIINHSVWGHWTTAAGTKTLTASINNASAVQQFTLAATTTGTTASSGHASTTVHLLGTNGPGSTAEDYTVTLVVSGTAADTLIRGYYLVWVV